ncbi:cullin C [Heterostelium album PN500]|uniref:Cullin C n=1 Tax=Heterostelium pallidum (strain ATCC 26659 / Pp 5 / PN500) TaxID=670386 RepID=D3BHJ6_HETP5|nr:cullin C [Heterostelium album PN500]EFA79173.1 cullin C [Heterostelium album PN500]|eukprot:XP_020431294.1 cullin C [Heterostelium album PN500]
MSTKPTKFLVKYSSYPHNNDPNTTTTAWKLLEEAIKTIHLKNASSLSFEELYRNAYNMVLHKNGEMLYNNLKNLVNGHLKEVAKQVEIANDEAFLNELNTSWSEHKTSMLMVRDILMYMDRTYVDQAKLPTVYDMGLNLFRDNVVHSPYIKDRLLNTLLDLIQKERNGEIIDRILIKNITQMLIDLGVNSKIVYEEDFETPFLAKTASYYQVESQQFISSCSCPDYMKKVEICLKEELERVSHYLDSSSEPKVKDVTEKQLISNHMKTLINMENSGLISMLQEDKIEDLKRMYNLFGRVSDGLNYMKEVISNHIREIGKEIVMDEEKTKEQTTFFQSLLDLKDKYDRLHKEAFYNDKQFQHSLFRAFEYFINLNPKSPEYISLFIDEKLKKGLKGVSEEEVDVLLDKILMLFRFIQEKDVFEKYYKQHLAKRLLLGRSVSDDAERNMIAKLKTECGYQFTSKLEGMFTDMRLSVDTMAGFKNYIQTLQKPMSFDLNVNVLTTGFWPTQSASNCILPREILHCCEAFKAYYLSNHNGRLLIWQTNMGTAEIKASFPSKTHELQVSTYQMVILLLFNESPKLTFKEISEQTGIPPVDLKRNLMALTSAKNKVLDKETKDAKEAPNKNIEESDVFFFNTKFKSKLFRVKIMSVVQKETPVEATETRQKVDEDRKHQIEASIVRIMKARKTMDHSNLISEVIKQLQSRFVPNPIIVKKRIESLIEREYLERSKQDRKQYIYMA